MDLKKFVIGASVAGARINFFTLVVVGLFLKNKF